MRGDKDTGQRGDLLDKEQRRIQARMYAEASTAVKNAKNDLQITTRHLGKDSEITNFAQAILDAAEQYQLDVADIADLARSKGVEGFEGTLANGVKFEVSRIVGIPLARGGESGVEFNGSLNGTPLARDEALAYYTRFGVLVSNREAMAKGQKPSVTPKELRARIQRDHKDQLLPHRSQLRGRRRAA